MIILILLGYFHAPGNDGRIERVRSSYVMAPNDSRICDIMIRELSADTDEAVLVAYLGGFKAVWAKHAVNPFSKLSTFKAGTRLIEKAVRSEPGNVEIRFIRLSVQKNCPFFLGYKKNIDEDTKFINANRNNIQSAQLKSIVDNMNKGE